jgi:hypothetical protein
MKLVTFTVRDGVARSGALIDGDRRIVDLQAAYRDRWKQDSPALSTVLAIAEGGQDALDIAAQTVKDAAKAVPGLLSIATR